MKRYLPVLLLVLSACAPTWQSSDAVSTRSSGEKSAIVAQSGERGAALRGDEVFLLVYRESGFIGSLTAWPVQYNGKNIGSLKNGTFIAIKTNAGGKNITPESHLGIYSEGVEEFTLTAKAGETYYLKHGPDSMFTSKVKIRAVDADKASQEIAGYSLVNVVNDYHAPDPDEVGKIAMVTGRVFIERGLKTIPARVGTPLHVDDKVNVHEGSRAHINLYGSGLLKITEVTSFQIPATETGEDVGPPKILKSIWKQIKVLIKGDRFEIKSPTVSSARG